MASKDKLIPTAIIMSNSLKGIKTTNNSFSMSYGKKRTLYDNNYTNAVYFFASIYAKELKISGGDATWNHKLVDGKNLTALYTPNRNIHDLTLGNVVASSEAEWNKLQVTISRAFNIVYPFDIVSALTAADILAYNNLMGVFDNGATTTFALTGADGSPLGTFAQGVTFADAWNTIKVPYDASIEVITYFIAPIFQPVGATKFYYRYTGLRRWFDFTGYNLI